MARFLRTETNSSGGHSRLRPPTVVGAGIAFHGPGTRLTEPLSANVLNRRKARSFKIATPLVRVVQLAPPLSVNLAIDGRARAARNQLQRKAKSFLRAPVLVFEQEQLVFEPIAGFLAPPRATAPGVVSRLGQPATTASTFVATPITVNLVGRNRLLRARRSSSTLFPPAVIRPGIAFHGPSANVVRVPPNFRVARSFLRPPPVAATTFVAAPITINLVGRNRLVRARKTDSTLFPVIYAAQVYPGIEGFLAKRKHVAPATRTFLRPPAAAASTFVAAPITVNLVGRNRLVRARRSTATLFPPSVIGDGIAFSGPRKRVTRVPQQFRIARSILRGPAVVTSTFVAAPNTIALVIRNRRARRTFYNLFPPVLPPDSGRIRGSLTKPRDTAPRVRSFLRPPTVVLAVAFHGPGVFTVRSTNLGRRATYVLRPPTVVATTGTFAGPLAHLAPSRRGAPKSRLLPVPSAFQPFPGVEPKLAYSRRGTPRSHLEPPTVVGPVLARAIDVTLAPQKRGTPKSILRKPIIPPTAPPVVERLAVQLTRAELERHTISRLSRPVVVDTFRVPVVKVTLARIRPVKTNPDLRPPTVIDNSPQAVYLTTWLTYSLRGKAKPFLGKPADLVDQQDLGFVRVRLAYSSRGRPVFRLQPPTVVGPVLARAIFVHLAPSSRGIPKSVLHQPTVVGPVLARPILVALDRIRPAHTIARLFPPAVVTAHVPEDVTVDVTLAYQSRGKSKSILRPPTVVAPVLAKPINVALTRIRPRPTTNHLFPPVVVYLAVELSGPETSLAPSRRGQPKSVLFPPIHPETFPPVHEEIAVQLTEASLIRRQPKSRLFPPTVVFTAVELSGPETTLVRIRPVRTIAHLEPPTVTDNRPQTVYLATWLTYSLRGKPRSFLGKPTDLVDQQDLGFVKVHLAYSLRGKPKPRLAAPTVVGPVLAKPIDVTLAPQKRGQPKSVLRPPVIPPVAPPEDIEVATRITLASSPDRAPHSRLFPPAVVAPVLARPVFVELARIKPVPVHSRIQPPTVVFPFFARVTDVTFAPQARGIPSSFLRPMGSPAVVYAPLAVHVAPSTRIPRAPHSRLVPPTVIDNRPQTYYLTVALTYSLRGKAKPHLFPPPAIQATAKAETVVAVTLAYSLRGKPKPKLQPPTVVTAATAYLRAIDTTIVRIRPVRTLAILGKPTDTVGIEDQGRVDVHLAYSLRGTPKSRLTPPTVVFAFVATPIRVELVRIRPVATHPVLRRPTDLIDQQDLGFVKTHLAYSVRGAPKSALREPTVVAPVLARAIQVTLSPQARGVPKSVLRPPVIPPVAPPVDVEVATRITLASSPDRAVHSRLFPPAVVAPVLARPVDVTFVRITPPPVVSRLSPPVPPETFPPVREEAAVQLALAEVRQRKTTSRLSPPTVVFTAVELSGPEVALAPSTRGKPKSFLRPMGSPAVVYAPLYIKLAPSTRLPRAPHSELRPPTVIDNRPQTYYLNLTLAYSLRGKAKPRLFPPPTIQATAKAETVVAVTLAYSLRGKPKFFLKPPTVVTAATAYLRAIDTTLVRIRPVRTIWILGRPADTVGLEDQGSVAVTLAPSFRGRPKPRLSAPTVVFAFVARPISVELAYSLRGRPISRLSEPTVVFPFFARAIDVTLAPQRRGAPKSLLAQVVYEARVYAPVRVELAPSRRGTPKSVVRKVVYAAAPAFGTVAVTLAPSRRGTAKSLLRQTVYGARVYAPIAATLAPSRLPKPVSFLSPPAVVGKVIYAPVAQHLAYSRRGQAKSSLRQVVYGAKVYAAITVTLVPQARGKTKSLLTSVFFARQVFAEVQVHLAPTSRLGRATRSKLGEPTVVFPFIARPISVGLVRIRPRPTIARLTPIPKVRFFARPISVRLARTPQKSVVSTLYPPVVIDLTPQVFYLNVTLAQIRPPKTTARILPPAVVNPYRAPVSSFIAVHLAYSRRGRPIHHLGFIPGLTHGGIVCGVVLDLTLVCQDITADVDTIIPGGSLETHVVSEETTASTVIMGETLAETRVDQEIE